MGERPQTHLPSGKVTNFTDQRVTAYGAPDRSSAEINLIISTNSIQEADGIEPISPVLEPVDLKAAAVGRAIIGSAGPVYPVEALVAEYKAFPEKYSKVDYHVKSTELSRPWLQKLKECLARLIQAKVGDECPAIPGTPSRDGGQARIINAHHHAKFGEEYAECSQSRISLFQEIGEIFSAARCKFSEQAPIHILTFDLQMARIVRPLAIGWGVNWIVEQCVRHATSVFFEMSRVPTQPAKHRYLLC